MSDFIETTTFDDIRHGCMYKAIPAGIVSIRGSDGNYSVLRDGEEISTINAPKDFIIRSAEVKGNSDGISLVFHTDGGDIEFSPDDLINDYPIENINHLYNCPRCGAPVKPFQYKCDYCGGAL